MKGKKNIYILLALVIFVWSMIGYRVYLYYTANEVSVSQEVFVNKNPVRLGLDSFNLFNDYPDPFLGSMPRVAISSNNLNTSLRSSTPAIKQPAKIVEVIKWPTISYKGIIKNDKKSKKYAIVTINNRERLVKENDAIDGITIFVIKKDSIGVGIGNEKRFFKK